MWAGAHVCTSHGRCDSSGSTQKSSYSLAIHLLVIFLRALPWCVIMLRRRAGQIGGNDWIPMNSMEFMGIPSFPPPPMLDLRDPDVARRNRENFAKVQAK